MRLGSRYLSLIGGTCISFYDWYCDLPPPSSPQIWGEQTDVAWSADWYNSELHHRLGLQHPADPTRRPLLHRGALQGTKTVAVARLFRGRQAVRPLAAPEAGHRRRAGDGHGPRDPQASSISAMAAGAAPISTTTRAAHRPADAGAREHQLADGSTTLVPDRYLRASDFADQLGRDNNAWKTLAFDTSGNIAVAQRLDRLPLGELSPRASAPGGTSRQKGRPQRQRCQARCRWSRTARAAPDLTAASLTSAACRTCIFRPTRPRARSTAPRCRWSG